MRVSCCLWWCMVLFMWTLLLWKRLGDRGWNITVWLTDLLDWGQCFPFWVVPGPMCGRSFLDGSARWSQLYSAALDPGVPAQQSPAKLIKKPIALHYRDFLFFFYFLFSSASPCPWFGWLFCPVHFWQPTSTVFIIDRHIAPPSLMGFIIVDCVNTYHTVPKNSHCRLEKQQIASTKPKI